MSTQRLSGISALVTRPKEQTRELQEALEAEGAVVVVQSAIEILPPENWNEVDFSLRLVESGRIDWIVFSSANGVRFVCDRIDETFPKLARRLGDFAQIAAVGESTANSLRSRGVDVALVPRHFDADGLVDALIERLGSAEELSFLSFRANRGRKTLSERLANLGATVFETTAYRSVDVKKPDSDVVRALRSGKIDFAIASSSASARSLVGMFGADAQKTKWIAISPLTANALRQQGLPVAGVARDSTARGLVEAIIQASK